MFGPGNFEENKEKKIKGKVKRKKKQSKKKKKLKSINYFYMLFQTHFTYLTLWYED